MVKNNDNNDEVDIIRIFLFLWSRKKILFIIQIILAILALMYLRSVPSTYKSEVVVVLNTDSAFASNFILQSNDDYLLTKLDTDEKSRSSKLALFVGIIKSREFLSGFISRHNLSPSLVAVKKWLHDTPQYDATIYNEHEYAFKGDVNVKNFEEKARRKLRSALTISPKSKIDTICISVELESAKLSFEIVSLLIRDIENLMEDKKQEEIKKNITYLQEMNLSASTPDLRKVIFNQLEFQMKLLALSEGQNSYILKVIDPPFVPYRESSHHRSIAWCVFMLVSFFLTSGMLIAANKKHLVKKSFP